MNWTEQSKEIISTMRINHLYWRNTVSETYAALSFAMPGEVVALTGPSRAGKTRLLSVMEEMLLPPRSSMEPGIMPVVSVLAANCSVNGRFSTKSFAIRALKALKHPFLSVGNGGDEWDIRMLQKLERIPEHTLRQAWEEALIRRKTRYVFIDETQHVGYAGSGLKEAAAILDSWKCLAQTTNTVLVLSGAYPLLQVLSQSPHLLGRKTQIHLPRYKMNIEGLSAFGSILLAYSEHLVLPQGVESLRQWERLLYQETFGCIGLLEKWLRRALTHAHVSGAEALEKTHFLQTRMPATDLKEIAREIDEGEKYLQEHMELPPDDPDVSPGEPEQASEPPKTKTPKKSARKPKPFRTKPRNYPIGGRV